MTTPSLPYLAAIGVLALALPLAACGRKGSLDPPPGGYALEQGTAKTPVSGAGVTTSRDKQPEYDEDGAQGIEKKASRRLADRLSAPCTIFPIAAACCTPRR